MYIFLGSSSHSRMRNVYSERIDKVVHFTLLRGASPYLSNQKLQLFQIGNDSRSGGTVGPMLSSAMGVRAIDAGMPQLSMHSIRAMTEAKDPGLGVFAFKASLDNFE